MQAQHVRGQQRRNDLDWLNRGTEDEVDCLMSSLFTDPVVSDKLVASLPTWGPAFQISLDLYIKSYENIDADADWAEILFVTSTMNQCCNIGDRIPALFAHKDGYIKTSTQIGNEGSKSFEHAPLDVTTWYAVELLQHLEEDKVTIYFCFFSEERLNLTFLVYLYDENKWVGH